MFHDGNLSEVGDAKRFFAPPIFPFPDVDVDPSLYEDDDDDEDDDASDNNIDLFNSHDFYSLEQDLFLVKYRCFQPELKMDEISQRFQKEFGVTRQPEQLEQRFQVLQSPEFRVLFALYLQVISLNKDAHYASGTYAILSEYQSLLRSTRTSCETKLFQLLYDDEKAQHEPNEMINVEIIGRNFPKYTRNVSKTQLIRCANTIQQLSRYPDAGVRASRHQAFTLQATGTRLEKLQLTDAVAFYDSCHVYNHLEQPIFDRLVQFTKDPNLMDRLALLRQQLAESSQIKHDSKRRLENIFEMQQRQRLAKLEQMRAEELDRMKTQLEKELEDDIQHIRRMHETLLKHEHAKIDAKYEEQMAMLNEKISEMKHETFELQKTCESNGWNNLERDILQVSLQVERIFGASDYLVRLLILAEDLDAEPLRRALISYLSEESKFPQFALRREMTSKMIPTTTVLEILKRCSTKDLREIELAENRFLHHELVVREIHTRKIAFGRFLSSLTIDKLRAALLCSSSSSKSGLTRPGQISLPHEGAATSIMDSEFRQQISAVVDFPDVLEQEFVRRRDFSCVKMNSQHLEKQISFSEEDCLLQLEVSHRYCTVLATKERKQGDSGKWMYENLGGLWFYRLFVQATIEVFSGDGESILLGWEVPRGNAATSEEPGANTSIANARGSLFRTVSSSSLSMAAAAVSPFVSSSSSSLLTPSNSTNSNSQLSSTLVPGLAPSQDGRSFGVTWQSDSGLDMGILHANGQSRSGVPCFRAGDVVGCTINQDDAVPHMRFYLNGEQVLPSLASAVNTQSYSAGIAVQNPPSCLYPALSMYSSKKKPQMRVRFNFRGGFQFPIAGFEPLQKKTTKESSMGITGLLPALKSVAHQVHIAKYAGKTVGIDAAGWLYRGAYSCPMDVVLQTKNADGYLNYCVQQIKLLQEHKVTPIFVFDGAHLPAKAELNSARNRNRQVWKTKAMRQLDSGDERGSYSAFAKAVSVSNEMVMKFIAVLRRMGITFYVAPYEADAQLAYLSRQKIIDVVVSEDSDCIPYGCKTILFKWSPDGWASELKRRSLGANEELSFVGWTEEMFIQLCVLCGCDYCPSIPGVGIVTAYKFVETHKSPVKVVKALEEQKHSALPPNYAERYYSAIITFRHHLVFDPRDKKMKMLNPLTLSSEILPLVDKELHFLGDIELRDEVVALIACGEVHPVTLDSYDWKEAAEALKEEQQSCLTPKPSTHSMTSTESSVLDKPERSRLEYDDQSSHCTSLSQPEVGEHDAQVPPHAVRRKQNGEREDREKPKPASTSWSHLDSVLGTSLHILNFRSPKVSDNFRPLVSLPNRTPVFHGGTTSKEMKEFENQSVRHTVKRIKNPTKRRREENGSGFEGEVMCRIDGSSSSQRPAKSSDAADNESTLKMPKLDSSSSAIPSSPPTSVKPMKRPFPFAFQNADSRTQRQESSSLDNSSGADSGSDFMWALRPFQQKPRAPSEYSSYSRATYAEEKWDRILGAEIDANSDNGSSEMQIIHSQSNESAASETDRSLDLDAQQ